jgi:branched-chain amino acid transport system substrate-binding protein
MQPDEEGSRETKDEGLKKPVSRREFLKYAGITGAAIGVGGGLSGLLAACGGKDETTTTAAGTGTTVVTGPEPPTQDKFVIGGARPVSGIFSLFEQAHFGPAYKMWVDDMNAAGGINIAGKKLPVELKVYDDQSDLDNCMRLMTKLMEEDKVDWLLGPQSTAFLFAGAGLAASRGYILCSAEGGATTLEAEMAKGTLPLFFQFLNYSNHYQMPVFAEICAELGAKTASVAYIDDLHGIEYQSQAQVFFATAGIKILSSVALPPTIKDVSSVIQKWEEEKADVICSFQYPDATILTLMTLIQRDYNPKAFLGGPGTSTQAIYDIFQGGADGVMFEGAWSPKISPEVKAYYDKLVTFVGDKANVDFWGPLIYRSELDFIQKCIEKAGTLKHEAIAEVLRTAHFPTLMSPDTFMTNQILDRSCYAGQIGQWQNGFPQVIDPGAKRTAEKIWYPKPTWKEAPALSTTSTS